MFSNGNECGPNRLAGSPGKFDRAFAVRTTSATFEHLYDLAANHSSSELGRPPRAEG